MALHWKHIKGFNKKSDGTLIYNFLAFKDTYSNIPSEDFLPELWINTNNSYGTNNGTNFGHIVTTGITNTFTKPQQFGLTTGLNTLLELGWSGGYFYMGNFQALKFFPHDDANEGFVDVWLSGRQNQSFGIYDRSLNEYFLQAITSYNSNSTLQIGTTTKKVNSTFNGTIAAKSTVTITDYCKAKYFNATSDIRAKENIHAVNTSMLDIANSIQIYTFNYKSNPERLIGVIAQELKDINIDGFELIDNKEATGENEDFMSVRESKLVYILLGAVQELSKEINELKKKIGE